MGFLSTLTLILFLVPASEPLLIPGQFNSPENLFHCQSPSFQNRNLRSELFCLSATKRGESEFKLLELMQSSGFSPIALSSEVGDKPVGIVRFGINLVLWRGTQGKIHILQDRCAHRFAKLSLGRVVQNKNSGESDLECPYHGFRFDGQGNCQVNSETGKSWNFNVKKFEALEENEFIWAKWGTLEEGEKANTLLDKLNNYRVIGFAVNWPAQWQFVMDNSLDSLHINTVHRESFAGIAKQTTNTSNLVLNETSDGLTWHYGRPNFYFRYHHPGVWLNHRESNPQFDESQGPLARIKNSLEHALAVVMVPVTEHETRVYFRIYRNYLDLPVIGDVVDQVLLFIFRKVAQEDERIVVGQQENVGQPGPDEVLLENDEKILWARELFKRAVLKQDPPEPEAREP